MRRLFHVLLNAATALSLLLCLATVALWVRSYFRADAAVRSHVRVRPGGDVAHDQVDLASYSGRTALVWQWTRADRGPDRDNLLRWQAESTGGRAAWEWKSVPAAEVRRQPGAKVTAWPPLHWSSDRRSREPGIEDGHLLVTVSDWLVALPLAAGPAWRLWTMNRRRIRRAHAAAGLCPSCGYDLRATPARCPECGMRRAQ